MRIPPYWMRASRDGFEAAGWSFTSLEEAKRVAEERVKILVEVLTKEREAEGRYLYGDRPVREPVVETISAGGKPEALVTRNAYGALCLNTEDVAFVDVDGEDGLEQIRAAHAAHPQWSLRVYRTFAGYRVAAVHARMSPTGSEAAELFEALGADPLYRKLCAAQESFRARLTPKPWRVGVRRIPGRYPWRDASHERAINAWVGEYDAASRNRAVCALLETLGNDSLDPVIGRVMSFHDNRVLAPGKPLA